MTPRMRELCFLLLLSGTALSLAWGNGYVSTALLFAALSTITVLGMFWSK
jgi:hypothetical protein